MTLSNMEQIFEKLGIYWYKVESPSMCSGYPYIFIELPKFRYIFKRRKLKKEMENIRLVGMEFVYKYK